MVSSMEVKLNTNTEPVGHNPIGPNKPRETAVPGDTVLLDGTDLLARALDGTPDLRPGVVERARELMKDVSYPPRETIQQIATLLAIEYDGRLG
jgi:hypothetical protein